MPCDLRLYFGLLCLYIVGVLGFVSDLLLLDEDAIILVVEHCSLSGIDEATHDEVSSWHIFDLDYLGTGALLDLQILVFILVFGQV